jgi:capsular polysaccharide biosynthesis protein
MDQSLEVFEAVVTPLAVRRDGSFDGGVFYLDGTPIEQALHVRSRINRIHSPGRLDEQLLRRLPPDDRPHLFAGILFNHFGHFLLESLGRLWAVAAAAYNMPVVFQPMWGSPDLRNPNHYVSATLAELGVSPDRIRVLTTPQRFSNLLVPPQLYGFYHMRDPDARVLEFFARAGQEDELDTGRDPASSMLYVSRSRIDIKLGRIAGEEIFEAYLRTQGYEVMYPESLPFPEQLRRYRRAKRIIFCEGSAVHSAILYRGTSAKIGVILRRYDTEGWIKRFFNALGIDVITINTLLRHDTCGLSPHMGVSVVDYLRASECLKEEGLVDNVFSEWILLSAEAIRSHYTAFVIRAGEEPGFFRPKINY